MKKTIALILAMLVYLGSFACASEERAEFDAACALLDAGDYDGAIAAFTSIELYQEISEKLAEAERMKDEQNAGFLYGNWIDLYSDLTYTFAPDGEGYTSENRDFSYVYEDGMVKITQPWMKNYEVVETGDIVHLKAGDNDLIREEDYAVAGPQTVEITMENWETYFEVREAIHVEGENAFGEFDFIGAGYGVFLRPEYEQRVANPWEDVQVSFKYTEAEEDETHYVEFNAKTLELTVDEPAPWGGRATHTGIISVDYFDAEDPYMASSEYAGHIAASYFDGVFYTDEGLIWTPIHDFTITDAAGTLKLLP